MTDRFAPDTADEVADVVREACAAGRRLELVAGGSRRGYGRPVEAELVLDLSALAGVVDYDPAELVLTARPATPMSELTALLAASGQHLAFEPPDFAPLWGGEAGAGTLGGLFSAGLAGPRRPFAGAPRDHLLGFAAVNGEGQAFSAGGKVIKNVTGYDLPKLVAGAMGTLAVLTEMTVKALPAPQAELTLVLTGLDEAAAVRTMADALATPAAVSGAAHLPDGHPDLAPGPATLLRLEGVPVSISARAEQLAAGETERLEGEASAALWRAIGAVHSFARPDELVWRVSLPPSASPRLLARLPDARRLVDWGGGLVWLFVPPAEDAHAGAVRSALRQAVGYDGHATLVRAPDHLRRSVPPFQPLEPGLLALTQRVKARFDPAGILNPGRLHEGY